MPPSTIGRYEIERELGRGGMAVVYLARDPYIKRQVAIKVLPRQFTFDSQFRARFQREAEVIAALEHPFIVPIYDFGEHQEQPYLVMRLMLGGSLSDRIRQGPLEVTEAANIIQRIGTALDRAHDQGIIHRDLKPGNILFDQYGDAFLSDFGIARLIESTSTLTGTGNIVGTPAYMSPEQVYGEVEIDSRSDIYALGVIVFELLTGRTPYRAKTPPKLMMKHVMEPVPRILAVNSDLPSGCETVITRAMAKDRDDRFATAGDLAAALTTVSDEQAAQATSPPTLLTKSEMPQTIVSPPGLKPPDWQVVKEAEAERKAKAEAERKAKEEAERKSREEAERKAKEEAERKAKEEAERKAKEEAERKAKEETERIAAEKAEAERKAKEEAERKAKEEAERKATEEAERIAAEKAEAERKAKEEAERKAKEEAERKAREETERPVPTVAVEMPVEAISETEAPQVVTAWSRLKSMPQPWPWIGAALVLLLIVGGAIIFTTGGSGNGQPTPSEATPEQTAALVSGIGDATPTLTPTNTNEPTATRTLTPRPTPSPTDVRPSPTPMPTLTPTPNPTPTLTDTPPLPTDTPTSAPPEDTPTPALPTDTPSPTPEPMPQVELLRTLVIIEDITKVLPYKRIPGVSSVSFSPDGSILVIASTNTTMQLWQVSDGELLRELEWTKLGPVFTAWSPDGAILAGGLDDERMSKVLLWRVSGWTQFRLLEAFPERIGVNEPTFTPDGTTLAAGGTDGIVRLWRVTDDGPVTPIQNVTGYHAAFSPDGQLLATTLADGTVQILQPFGGGLLHTLMGHTDAANSVAFSPDGKLLASGGRDNTIRLWQVSDGALLNTLEGHTDDVHSVAFSPDGAMLASGSQDGTVRLWQVEDGSLMSTLGDHGVTVWSVAFSSQGILASGGADGTARLWRVR